MPKLYVVTYQDQDDYQEKWEVMVSDKETEDERIRQFEGEYREMRGLEDSEDVSTFIADVQTYVMEDVNGYTITATKK